MDSGSKICIRLDVLIDELNKNLERINNVNDFSDYDGYIPHYRIRNEIIKTKISIFHNITEAIYKMYRNELERIAFLIAIDRDNYEDHSKYFNHYNGWLEHYKKRFSDAIGEWVMSENNTEEM